MSPTHLLKIYQSFWHSHLELFVSVPQFPRQIICLIWIAQISIHSKNEIKWSPFWPLYHVGNFAGLLSLSLSLHVYVCCCKQGLTHFNDKDKERLKVYRQETKKSICWWRTFYFWGDINCFVRLKPIQIL